MYSVMLSLKEKKVTIVGGGKVAFRKAHLLIEEDCEIQVIAPKFIEEFKSLAHKVNRVYKNYEEGDCVGSYLVFAATDDKVINEAVAYYCKRANILCNVVDNPELSTFTTPAQLKRGDLTISISTGGHSPSLASKIKSDLEAIYGEECGEYIRLLGTLREKVLKDEADETKKRAILSQVVELDYEALKDYTMNYLKK